MGLKLVDSMLRKAEGASSVDNHSAVHFERGKFNELVETVLQVNGCCVIASETVDELLTYDKLDEKKLEISVIPIHPWSFVQKSASPFQLKARAKGISFHVSLSRQSGTSGDWVSRYRLVADEFKMNQVIRNLVSNAIKFTFSGGSVDVRVEMIANYESSQIECHDADDRLVRITVKDTGAGISRGNLKRLFHQYVQINPSALQHGEGSGLGLWISRSKLYVPLMITINDNSIIVLASKPLYMYVLFIGCDLISLAAS
jgi:signal transduction histidine kinase